ncbi:hypothetical protein [Ferrimonas sp. YFM]|uniref:hypothetical protein n=1 Tax=Ferrimonas sp. YFM TaxID=3028878 RepID=UPI0025724CBA|nr:hypothetical protein [Ferrimonas sp. YFM]
MSKVERTVEAAQRALADLIAEGARISQHAVEKRAGLANGALNYKHPLYRELKARIINVKSPTVSSSSSSSEEASKLAKERELKDRYRTQRNELRGLLRIAEGEKLELQYQLYHMQKYIKHLEQHGIVDANVLEFSLKNRPVNNLK